MKRSLPLLMLVALGCQPADEIRRYRVEKPEKPAVRLLAAVVPGGDKIWFVKLTGKPEAVEGRKAEFETFVGSMTFAAGTPPVTYTVPADWREVPSQQALRHATFQVGPENMELTIIPLGQEAAALKPNVDRWRGQIGLPPIPEADLPTVTRTAKLGDKDVTFVDMTGKADLAPLAASPMVTAKPQAAKRAVADAPAASKPIAYDVPAGWTEQPLQPGGMRVAAFRVGTFADGKPVDATVIPLPGQSGSLLDNVNRWRKEVELPPVTEADLSKHVVPLDVGGAAGYVVDCGGPESAGAKRERTLGLVLPRGSMTWFVKLRGPYELVSKQKPAFEAFVKSLRFTDAGGKP